ncbi:hypothetical protein DEO48_10615 [Enterobacter sp. CGMCC 5087]|uniref:hypothetical protein n=1 Tax=Enterobacter sp. CGMCC 5087 TaxID=2183878 RepID=UPI000D67CFEA|nr:hypothetical protein [Enterobacter sp. CGMCC 5087]PWI80130.1 hypothetical protein DEO48_10615 [Enterobacter sp. CGMCC 5087]
MSEEYTDEEQLKALDAFLESQDPVDMKGVDLGEVFNCENYSKYYQPALQAIIDNGDLLPAPWGGLAIRGVKAIKKYFDSVCKI